MKIQSEKRKLVAALACRNQGTRLYGKPMQNLHVEKKITVLDNIISCFDEIDCIDQIILGVAEGDENLSFCNYSNNNNLDYITGDEEDVLQRLILCGEKTNATDILRVSSESPFPHFEYIEAAWKHHVAKDIDATFLDNVIDGCGFEVIKLDALRESHINGENRHRSELCTLYIRENIDLFEVERLKVPEEFDRKDLRLTVDNPEDLIVCKAVYEYFSDFAPMIPVSKIIKFLDDNEFLVNLTLPFTELGYESMNVWKKNEEE